MREEKAAIADGKGSFRLETYTLEEPAGDGVLVLNWATPCYICFQCQEGNQHICEVNSPVTSGNTISDGHARLGSSRYQGTLPPGILSRTMGEEQNETVSGSFARDRFDREGPMLASGHG